MLQCVNVDYFLQKSKEDRVAMLTDKKKFQKLCDMVQGILLMEGNRFNYLKEFTSKEFESIDAKVLVNSKKLLRENERIYHDAFNQEVAACCLDQKDVLRVIKKYFDKEASVPTTVNGLRVRYFKLKRKNFDFLPYLKKASMHEFD